LEIYMAEHNTLTGADLHECKGASTAAANTLLQANGAGTATFVDVLSTLKARNRITLFTQFTDISTASSEWVASPMAGKVIGIYVTLHGAITTANATVTAEIGGVALSGLSITITQAGSAAGSTFSGTPSGNNTIAAGQALEIISDGASSTAVVATVSVLIDTE
jgi:hypothetical protein